MKKKKKNGNGVKTASAHQDWTGMCELADSFPRYLKEEDKKKRLIIGQQEMRQSIYHLEKKRKRKEK